MFTNVDKIPTLIRRFAPPSPGGRRKSVASLSPSLSAFLCLALSPSPIGRGVGVRVGSCSTVDRFPALISLLASHSGEGRNPALWQIEAELDPGLRRDDELLVGWALAHRFSPFRQIRFFAKTKEERWAKAHPTVLIQQPPPFSRHRALRPAPADRRRHSSRLPRARHTRSPPRPHRRLPSRRARDRAVTRRASARS